MGHNYYSSLTTVCGAIKELRVHYYTYSVAYRLLTYIYYSLLAGTFKLHMKSKTNVIIIIIMWLLLSLLGNKQDVDLHHAQNQKIYQSNVKFFNSYLTNTNDHIN